MRSPALPRKTRTTWFSRSIALAVGLGGLLSVGAAVAGDVREEIYDLAVVLQREAFRSQASAAELARAKSLMEDALAELRRTGGGEGPDLECVNCSYEKYFTAYSQATAYERALAACRRVRDLALTKYLLDKYYTVTSAVAAIDLAAANSTEDLAGKRPVIEFAFAKYFTSASTADAVNLALAGARGASRDALPCLERSWTAFYSQYSASEAMNRAFAACR